MKYCYRLLSKLPKYYQKFGFYGLWLLLQIESGFSYKSKTIRAYKVPGFGKVYLRDSASDHAIFWQCLVEEQYDTSSFPHHQNLMKQYDEIVAQGKNPVILDLGGNIGLASLWFVKRFPEAKVLVVEPSLENLELLEKNTAGRKQIQIIRGAIWNASGWVRIVNPEAGFAAFQVAPAADDKSGIRAYTVEEILEIAGSHFPFIVKIDIEGAQSALFAHNTEWVGRSSLIILELDDWLLPWRGTSRTFFSCISQYPFEYLLRGENLFCFRDCGA